MRVVFTSNNARIVKDNKPVYGTVVVDPDLSRVRGIPPHFWKLVDGAIVEMSRPEKVARLAHIAARGSVNVVHKPRLGMLYYLLPVVALATSALALWVYYGK